MEPIHDFEERMVTIATVKCPHCDERNEYDMTSLPVSASNAGFFAVYCEHCGRRFVTHPNKCKFEVRNIFNN